MSSPSVQRVIVKTSLNLILPIFGLVVGFFFLDFFTWASSETNVSINVLYGLLAIMASALMYLRIRTNVTLSSLLFICAFLLLGIGHLLWAITYLLGYASPGSILPSYQLAAIIIEMWIFGTLILLALIVGFWFDVKLSKGRIGLIAIISFLIPFVIFWLIFQFLLPSLHPVILQIIGLVFSPMAIIAVALSVMLLLEHRSFSLNLDLIAILTALVLFGLSIPFVLGSLLLQNQIWILVILTMVFSLLFFNLTISIPLFSETGMETKTAVWYSWIWPLFIFIPFIVSLGLEKLPGILTFNPLFDYGLYAIVHAGAVLLSMSIFVLIFLYSRLRPARSLNSLTLAFMTWGIVELVLLVQVSRIADLGESLVPYIIGYIGAIILLILTIFWRQSNPEKTQIIPRKFQILITSIGLLLSIMIGEYIQQVVEIGSPIIGASPLNQVVLLVLTFLNVFLFIILGYQLLRDFKGKISIELLSLSFLMLWLTPGFLKGIFLPWDMGWWAAEFSMLTGLLLGPVIFGVAYSRAMFSAVDTHREALLFSDLIMHDIGNYHQIILNSVDMLERTDLSKETRTKTLKIAQDNLVKADQLIRNVRRLSTTQDLGEELLGPIDLVKSIQTAIDDVLQLPDAHGFTFNFDSNPGQYYILATPLLTDIFQNLFKNAVENSPSQKRVDVRISSFTQKNGELWQVDVIDYGIGIPPEQKQVLFSQEKRTYLERGLGLLVVSNLVTGFGGQIIVRDRVPDDYEQGTVFSIRFPIVDVKEVQKSSQEEEKDD